MIIKEIFGPTVQGEGTYAGQVVMFIRFSGCNKWNGKEESKKNSICSFCDTDFVGGKKYNLRQLLEEIKRIDSKVKHIVLSGGEPTLQINEDLLSFLKSNGYFIHLETNGSRDLGPLINHIDHITMSPKQSVEETKLSYCHDLKILYPYINSEITVEKFKNYRFKQGYLQPVENEGVFSSKTGLNTEATLKKLYELRDWKLSLQQHKILEIE